MGRNSSGLVKRIDINKILSMVLALFLLVGSITLSVSGLDGEEDTDSETSSEVSSEVSSDDESGELEDEKDALETESARVPTDAPQAQEEILEPSPGYIEVSNFAELKAALENGTATEIVMKADGEYKATSSIGVKSDGTFDSGNHAINRDIRIFGNGAYLEMGNNVIYLKGSHNLEVYDLKASNYNDADGQSTVRYGLFSIRDVGSTTSPHVWNAKFTNFYFEGAGLVSGNATSSSSSNNDPARYFLDCELIFDEARWEMYSQNILKEKKNEIHLLNLGAYGAVVYARNVTIDGDLSITTDLIGSSTGGNTVPYQAFFRSPGSTNSYGTEVNGTVSVGTFTVTDGSQVYLMRDSRNTTKTTDGIESEYYRSLVIGYEYYYFGKGSRFEAYAGTNRREQAAANPTTRSAIIRSNACKEFIVDEDATMILETLAPYRGEPNKVGLTALYLFSQSGQHLDIEIRSGAVVDITADAEPAIGSADFRHRTPVLLTGTGSSTTKVAGTLTVHSENANAWAYRYSTSKISKQEFIVQDGGIVTLTGNNEGKLNGHEYAAFEAYGNYDTSIIVEKGGKMDVLGNGFRGMSLAGAAGSPKKTIDVAGELTVRGWSWAIAAETRSDLSITARDGGKVYLATNDPAGNASSVASAGDPSTVYSTGNAKYTSVGEGSQIYVVKKGGVYGTLFHDGLGHLQIDIRDGGNMIVNALYEQGLSTSKQAAIRAAICAQSTSAYSTNNYITVDGEGSGLYVYSNNKSIHGNTDEHFYSQGAITLNGSTTVGSSEDATKQGHTLTVSNGANFEAISDSRSPTVELHNGTMLFSNPGYFHIRNNSVEGSDTKNGTNPYGNGDKEGHAVYNHDYFDSDLKSKNYYIGTGYGPSNFPAIKFENCDVKVWSTFENQYGYAEEYLDNEWKNVSFDAYNKLERYIKTVDSANNPVMGSGGSGNSKTKWGDYTLANDEFHLSSYGRINGTGTGSSYSLKFNKVDEEEPEEALEGAEFVIWRYGQIYVDGYFDHDLEKYVKAHYIDDLDSEKEYYSDQGEWIKKSEVASGNSNLTKITTTNQFDYNGVLENINGSNGQNYHLEEVALPAGYELHPDDADTIFVYGKTGPFTIRNVLQEVLHGSLTIEKLGDENTALPNATFSIERYIGLGEPDEEDLVNPDNWKFVYLDSTGEWQMTDDADAGDTITTGADGKGKFADLPDGIYRITETKAPEGYSALQEPFTVTLPLASETRLDGYDYDNLYIYDDVSKMHYYYDLTYTVTDEVALELPLTGNGGWMPYMFAVMGIVVILMASAVYMYFYERKRRKMRMLRLH